MIRRHELTDREWELLAPLRQIQTRADAAGDIDWLVQIDSTIVRAHQHAAATGRKGGSTGNANRTITPSVDPEEA
ncbi:insertion element transposase (plasmid) [Streptomyces sp. CA-256286]|nr:insertion element transposase [Streptomyces sp. CA-256286]